MSPAGVVHGAVCRAHAAASRPTVHMEGHSGLRDPCSCQHARREALERARPEAAAGSARWECAPQLCVARGS